MAPGDVALPNEYEEEADDCIVHDFIPSTN